MFKCPGECMTLRNRTEAARVKSLRTAKEVYKEHGAQQLEKEDSKIMRKI